MSKTILLMRHAKSSWDNPSLKDINRPLNNRGKSDAVVMAKWLKKQGLYPNQIFCSPALRTRQTVQPIQESLGFSDDSISYEDSMYFSGEDAYLNLIHSASESSNVILLIGHNPMTENMVHLLVSLPAAKPIKTAVVTHMTADTKKWIHIQHHTCQLNWIYGPKDLPESYR